MIKGSSMYATRVKIEDGLDRQHKPAKIIGEGVDNVLEERVEGVSSLDPVSVSWDMEIFLCVSVVVEQSWPVSSDCGGACIGFSKSAIWFGLC